MVASKWRQSPAAAATASSDQVSGLNLLDKTNFATHWNQNAMELGNQAHILSLAPNGDILCVQFEGEKVGKISFREEMEERTPQGK